VAYTPVHSLQKQHGWQSPAVCPFSHADRFPASLIWTGTGKQRAFRLTIYANGYYKHGVAGNFRGFGIGDGNQCARRLQRGNLVSPRRAGTNGAGLGEYSDALAKIGHGPTAWKSYGNDKQTLHAVT